MIFLLTDVAETIEPDFLTENWELIRNGLLSIGGVTIGNALLSVFTFFKSSISGKKIKSVTDFTVIADQNIKNTAKVFKETKTEIVTQIKSEIVEPIKENVTELVNSTQQLSSLCATLIALVPMDLETKRIAFATVQKITSVSSDTMKLLETSIKVQETQEAEEKQDSENLNQDIDNI